MFTSLLHYQTLNFYALVNGYKITPQFKGVTVDLYIDKSENL